MEIIEGGLLPQDKRRPDKLTAAQVAEKIKRGESLENLDLQDLNLAGLPLAEKSFRGADLRGVSLYQYDQDKDKETVTNISRADFREAILADTAGGCDFFRVDAEGAKFGYSETLADRRTRHQNKFRAVGQKPPITDSGAFYRFDGSEGNFQKTFWLNVDFGSGTDFNADFTGADLSGATFAGCDLSGLDLSRTKIAGLKLIGFNLLDRLIINENQVAELAAAIKESGLNQTFAALLPAGAAAALKECFNIVILN